MAKVMLVEDDIELAELYKVQFEKSGYEFHYVSNGLEALTKTGEIRPDVILLDIMLPGTNGLEVLKKLKQETATAHIPVIILSNLPEEAASEKGLNLGAISYLVKSDNTPLQVIAMVQSIVKGKA